MNTALINGLWQGALISAVTALVTLFLPQRHAATRYAVWFSALIALALLPILTLWHPAQTFAGIPGPIASTAAVTASVTAKAAGASGEWLVVIWLVGGAFCLGRLVLSYARIHDILRNATPAPELGERVLLSGDISVPIAAGFFNPSIIVPTHLLATLEPIDLESIVRHERAHIARLDILGNLIQRIIEACLFFNPWVYVIGRQLVQEREAACDDWAVHASGEPIRYASCLAHVAQSVRRGQAPLLTPSAIGSKRMLFDRIARLLSGKATQLKINYVILSSIVMTFVALAVLFQTSALATPPTPVAASRTQSTSSCEHFANIIDAVAPNYPESARLAHPGPVNAIVSVTVSSDGTPVNAKTIKSSLNAAIDRSTIAAALASTYSPAMIKCKPTTGQYLFKSEFN